MSVIEALQFGQQTATEALVQSLTEQLQETRAKVDELTALVQELADARASEAERAIGSAGGLVADLPEGEDLPLAAADATGDIKTTHQVQPGWLEVYGEGSEVSRLAYPELYDVIGDKYGPASYPDLFKLPGLYDMPGIVDLGDVADLLANGQKFVIRT